MQLVKFLKSALFIGVCTAALAGATQAAEFNIPAGDLRDALSAYMAQTGPRLSSRKPQSAVPSPMPSTAISLPKLRLTAC